MQDSTAIVTGASSGIGAAVARRFASEGAHVVICGRDTEPLEAVAERVRQAGGSVTARRADVRNEYDVRQLVETAADERGSIDVVVANAGVYHGQPGDTPLAEESYVSYDDHFQTNARGVYTTVREAAPYLSANGRVLVPSGQVAREAEPGFGSYAVSKAAAEALARGFAAELEQVVGVVDPGQVTTPLTDGAPGRDPNEVADLFLWAATEASADQVDGAVVGIREWRDATR